MKTILFDLDGTLSNSKEGITKSAQYALHHYGIEEPDADKLEFFIGPPLTYTFAHHYGMDEETAVEATAKYRERYRVTGIYECHIYDGVEKLLSHLREKGYRIGMASSKPEESCKIVLEHLGILQYFHDVAGATMDGRINSKAEVLREALRRIPQEDHDQTVLIGDTQFDVEGAKEVGVPCVGITYGFGTREELEESGAVAVFDTLEEVEDYLETI